MGRRLVGSGRGDAQLESQLGRRPDPRRGHVARAVSDKRDDLSQDGTALFLEREDIGEDLAGVLIVRERVDRRNAGMAGEVVDVLLGKGADDRAMDHAAEAPGA